MAKSGAKTAEVIDWLDDLPVDSYDVAVAVLGVNDVTRGVTLRRWLGLQSQLFDRIGEMLSPCRIIVSALPPIGQFPVLPHPLCWGGRRHVLTGTCMGWWRSVATLLVLQSTLD